MNAAPAGLLLVLALGAFCFGSPLPVHGADGWFVRLTQLGHDLLGTVALLHEEFFPASSR